MSGVWNAAIRASARTSRCTGLSGVGREPCPAAGRVVGRDFARARVLVNPGDVERRVPLAATFATLDGGPVPDPLVLGAHAGRVLVRADHTASLTSSGRAGR